jgi:hypothetical protein
MEPNEDNPGKFWGLISIVMAIIFIVGCCIATFGPAIFK